MKCLGIEHGLGRQATALEPAFPITERLPLGQMDGNGSAFDHLFLEWDKRLRVASYHHLCRIVPLNCYFFLLTCLVGFYSWGPNYGFYHRSIVRLPSVSDPFFGPRRHYSYVSPNPSLPGFLLIVFLHFR